MAKTVALKDLSKEIKGFSRSHLEELKQATVVGIAASIPDLVKDSPVDTGLFASSWDMTITEESVLLGNYAPHSPIIEFGARPFTPPLKPLLAWAKRVLGDGSQPPNYSSAVWGLAKYTQNKIANEGMKPRNVMANAIPKIIKNIESEYKKYVNG